MIRSLYKIVWYKDKIKFPVSVDDGVIVIELGISEEHSSGKFIVDTSNVPFWSVALKKGYMKVKDIQLHEKILDYINRIWLRYWDSYLSNRYYLCFLK